LVIFCLIYYFLRIAALRGGLPSERHTESSSSEIILVSILFSVFCIIFGLFFWFSSRYNDFDRLIVSLTPLEFSSDVFAAVSDIKLAELLLDEGTLLVEALLMAFPLAEKFRTVTVFC
jgi:hypothetical protein